MSGSDDEDSYFTNPLADDGFNGTGPLEEWLEWFRQPGLFQAGAAELVKHAVALGIQNGVIRIKQTEAGDFKLALPKAWIEEQFARRFP